MMSRETMVEVLKNNVVKLTFTKKNGEARDMRCTLREDLLPQRDVSIDNPKERKSSNEVIAVYDLEKKDWRSFRIDSVNTFEVARG